MKNEKIDTNFENNMNQQNSNSEVKPRNKNVTIILVLVIIVLLIAIGVCVGLWFAGDTTKIINNKDEVIKEENGKTEENTSKKIDETKPWVYDAEFNEETKTIYETSDNKYFITSDECLKVPFININSEDAQKANLEIKKLYEEWYTGFGKVWEDQSGWKSYQQYHVGYEFYENNNIISIVIKESNGVYVVDGDLDGETRTLYTFNFNLETLNYATLDEMAKVCGFNSGIEVTNKITAWETAQYNFAKDFPDKVSAIFDGVCKDKYFINSNRELSFVYKFTAASRGDIAEVIKPNIEIENFYDMSNTDESEPTKESNENKIIKHLAPAGWAGSSNHEIRLYSNGDVYHVVYSGEGIAEEYIVRKELIAKNATDMEEKRRGQGFEAIIIKGENVEIIKNEESWIKFEKEINSEEQILCEDFSFMSGLKNTVYETLNVKEGERYFKISFDENSNPTIYIEDVGAQPYATYRRFYNVNSDVAAGSAYVEFNYRTLNETGDFQTGKIKYSNVTNNDFIYLTMPETNGEMIKLYNLKVDYISQLHTKTIINEYGDSSKSAEVFGRQFIPITGIKGKESVYYIDENNDLYKMDLVNLNVQILANYVKDIQIDQNNIIHAYPIGDSFMNNICMLDEFVVFEDLN